MPRPLIIIVTLIALAFVASACNGDDTPTSPTPVTPTATPTPTPVPTPEPTPTPTPEPTPTSTPVPTPTPTPTPSPVTQIVNPSEFLDQFAEKRIIQRQCTLDAAAGEVDCGGDGLYRPLPPPAQEAVCAVLLVDEAPIAITCSIQEPLTITYYATP